MGKPLTPAQEKIRDDQILKNENFIEMIDSLLEEIEPFYIESNKYNTYLVDLFDKLNNAHGMLMQGEYANLYTKNLASPVSAVFDFYNSVSDEFCILDEKLQKELLKDLPDLDRFQDKINYFFNKIKPLFDDVNAENSIIVRFEGLEQIYIELKRLSEDYWSYPKELAVRQALHNREFIQPVMLHGIPRTNPFHIKIYIDYSPKLNTALLLKGKLLKLKPLLKTINAQLPFAELNEKVPHIQNIVNGIDKSTSIGEHTSIGNNNAIGDKSSVRGE
ncbi:MULTISPECIES: hypothetical protein [Bacillaceae]|uniref:Uncharacterized protein n=1 Tax=Evansella alkalicola TaxID=745819 RepID=A0ABS6JSU0_9BACI|nr:MULTISPECIES: hypothetical protein [Bacillaceae]MBU9721624.1 hypothetical protein [Bacillus alkalicola]